MWHFLGVLAILASEANCNPFPRQMASVPQYVLDFAPVVYIDKEDEWFPSDISVHLANSRAVNENFTAIEGAPSPLTLENLDSLNALGGEDVYLASIEGIVALPDYFRGTRPAEDGSTPGAVTSVIITVPKDNDILDAFYGYFYTYNEGIAPLGIPGFNFGNHVGDWEHTMVRFKTSTGEPQAIWYSQHSLGQAFGFEVVSKLADTQRPVVYSARGSHANYATPGQHESVIPGLAFPGVLLPDETSEGPFWDPTLSAFYFSYDLSTESFTSLPNPVGGDQAPSNFLQFLGHWGDPQLPADDPAQVLIGDFAKYEGGPTGPLAKRLGRKQVCNVDDNEDCYVKRTLIGAKA
jgi:hypothetical protein